MKQTALFEADADARTAVPWALESFWSMEHGAFARLREALASASPDRLAAVPLASDSNSDPGYENRGGVAVIRFEGVVSKSDSMWSRMFGGRAVTTKAAAAVNAAAADPAVKSILFVIDSPGGTVAGTADLADTLFNVRAKKPVTAYCEDLCASAAYWIGSQATELVGNATASVGSIGVFSVLPDISRLAKNIGVEVNVVRSAPGKGAGTMGTQITDAQLADVQKHVDALHQQFVGVVARGRGMSAEKAAALADGRLHVGQGAVTAGLIDRIAPLADVLAGMQASDDDDDDMSQGALGASVAHTHTTDGSNPSPATTTTRAEAPATEPRAEGEGHLTAQKEDPMAENTPATTLVPGKDYSQAFADMNAKFEALAKENADLKVKLAGVSENVVSMTTQSQLVALLEKARTECKLTKGNEAALEPAIRAMAAVSMEKAVALVESLPKLAKGEGSVLATSAAAAGVNAALEPGDHVGAHLSAYKPDRAPVHQAATEFMARSRQAGKPVSYSAAVIAVTRKTSPSAAA